MGQPDDEVACGKCGDPAEVEVVLGDTGLTVFACRPCYNRTQEELAVKRQQFEELLRQGKTREEANLIMINSSDERN